MPSVNVYTLTEFGGCTSRGREVTAAEADAAMEEETARSESRLHRARRPYSGELGDGFQIGTGDDGQYDLVLLERY